jgi:hypothetical protein
MLISGTARAQDAPPAAHDIESAAALHVSTEGFRTLGQAIKAVLPTGITATGLSGEFDCGDLGDDDDSSSGDDDDSASAASLQYSSQDIVINISPDEVVVQPTDDRILISLTMTLWSEPAEITLDGTCLIELSEVCTLSLQPTALNIDISMQMALTDGAISAQVESMSFSHGNFGNPIETGCLLGDVLDTLQSYNVDLIGEVLGDVLDGQVAELETQLEDALGSLTGALAIEQQLDLLGAQIDVSLSPNTLDLSDTGLLLGFGARVSTPAYGSCVPHEGAYQLTSHDMPALTGLLADSTHEYHLGMHINEDFANQFLYAAWQGGALCINLEELSGFEITTDYLSLVEGELVTELWPEPQRLDLRVEANEAPKISFVDEPHFDADFELNTYSDELDRQTRFWALNLLANGTVGMSLDQGSLSIDLGFDLEQDLGISVSYNEWLHPDLARSFGELLPDLAAQVLDVETLAPSFALPSFYGVSLGSLQMQSVGANQDYLALYGWIDPTVVIPMELGTIDLAGVGCGDTAGGGDIVISGCESEESGCADSGCSGDDGGGCDSCDGGCSTARRVSPSTILLLLLPFLGAARRRR